MIKLKKHKQSKQSGMTAIMLAMFLAIVVSLLSVGFATLVRKDQAETLDKTLSYQAQYAAESGVNKAISFIDENPGATGSDNCSGNIDYNGQTFGKSFKVGDADVTCAVWSKGAPEMVLEPSVNSPKFSSFTGVDQISVSWNSEPYAGTKDDLPTLVADKTVLGVTISDKNATYSNMKRYYLLPHGDNGCGSEFYLGNGANNKPNGSVLCAKVDESDGVAKVIIKGFTATNEYYINVNPINGSSAVPVTVQKGGGNGTFVNTSQYKIDVNAKAQDITKRVIVYYNPSGTPGKPYVVNILSGGTICKDYQVDGSQDKSVSEAGNACPNPPTP